MATGPYHWLKLFESQMQSKEFILNGVTATGQKFSQGLFGILEPIMMYRYIFPKEGEDLVTKTLGGDEPLDVPVTKSVWAIKKALGLRDFKKNIGPAELSVTKANIRLVPIGIKDEGDIILPTGEKHERI